MIAYLATLLLRAYNYVQWCDDCIMLAMPHVIYIIVDVSAKITDFFYLYSIITY